MILSFTVYILGRLKFNRITVKNTLDNLVLDQIIPFFCVVVFCTSLLSIKYRDRHNKDNQNATVRTIIES